MPDNEVTVASELDRVLGSITGDITELSGEIANLESFGIYIDADGDLAQYD